MYTPSGPGGNINMLKLYAITWLFTWHHSWYHNFGKNGIFKNGILYMSDHYQLTVFSEDGEICDEIVGDWTFWISGINTKDY